ncbi:S8 family serine peptidase [Kribbella sp. NPDC020789]
MRTWRRLAAGVLGLAAITSTASGSTAASPPPAARDSVRTITLITGDRVELRGAARPMVTAGQGRAGTRFHISKDGTDTYVVPSDALPLIGAGRLDRRLFDITKLTAFGYTDDARQDIPLIVEGAGAGPTLTLKSVGGVAVRQPKAQAADFWRRTHDSAKTSLTGGVRKIWLDGQVSATLDQSVPQIGAPAAWQAGHTGAGVKVAVLDSGIDATHADLSGAIAASADFTGSESGPDDRWGHGTHVASTITGSGAASDGKYRGVAPDAELLNGKVLGDDGRGPESSVIAGMEWAVAQGADVVNLSLGSEFASDGTGPMDQAVNRLSAESGALFVVAAGNDGPGTGTVGSPAAADAALAVGAVDKSDQLAEFSSRGPRRGDGGIKPDITAPGVGIVAARAQHATIGTPVGSAYLRLDGTSMAAPHVAGAAAILAGQHPDWTATELKAALMDSADPHPDLTVYQQGTGRVNVARASAQQIRADVGSLDLGEVLWPHTDDKPVQRTVTYHNDGDQPVGLTVSADDIKDRQGAPAPDGMFSLSARTLTVPAHGSAAVQLTANPATAGPVGTYQGALVATAAGIRVRTIVALYLEPESYDVTVQTIDWDGNPDRLSHFMIANVATPGFVVREFAPETMVLRLPKGTYYYEGFQERITSQDPFGYSAAHFVEPNFTVAKDETVILDARDAVPVVLRTDHPEDDRAGSVLGSWRDTPYGGKASVGFWSGGTESFPILDDIRVRPSKTSAPGEYEFSVEGLLAKQDGHGGYLNSPYQYHLKWAQDGVVPATLDRRFPDRELAQLRTTVAAQVPGDVVTKDGVARITTPGTLVEWYSPGFAFFGNVSQWSADEDQLLLSQSSIVPTFFATKGTVRRERWNVGPLMPALSPDRPSQRNGDHLTLDLWMYSDQNLDHVGSAAAESGSTKLLRDGVEIASSDSPGTLETTVPAGAATYRLETEVTRGRSSFSSRQTAAWTFRSSTTTAPAPLPLMLIRFAPELDDRNQAPGGWFAVPVNVQRRNRETLTSLAVEVSYDDGATWKPAKMRGQTALVDHPRRPGFVSLRATATDSAGNKAEQTVIHAYQLGQLRASRR